MIKKIVFFLALIFSVLTTAQDRFKTHAVKEGETVESIAKLYRVTPYAILKLNPEVKRGIKKNTILIIPNSSTVENDQSFKEKITFTEHKVRRKETLFSISQRYNVPIEEIKRYNKQLYSRQLDKGEKIRIPKIEYIAEKKSDSLSGKLAKYVVKAKEGKWRIAYEHGISVAELEEINPNMGFVLQQGQEIWVPVLDSDQTKTVDNLKYNYYTVQPKEGFFRLKTKFGIEKDSIIALNPEAKEGLKEGMILKLPKDQFGDYSVQADGKLLPRFTLVDSINTENNANIAIAIPLKLDQIDFSNANTAKSKLENDKLLGISLDFYSGVLMAVDSLKQLGVNADIKILDTEGSEVGVAKILNSTDFSKYNAVIGPFTHKSFNKLSYGLRKDNTPVFAPFSNKSIELYGNVFQTLPTDDAVRNKMIDFIVERGKDKHIVIIADSKNATVKSRLMAKLPQATVINTVDDNYVKMDALTKALSDQKENWVIVESNHIPLLTNVTNILNSLRSKRKNIMMLTTNKGDAYETSDDIKNSYLSALQLHYPTVDKPSSLNNSFNKQYQERFGITPSRYAIRGFDLMMDVVLRATYKPDLFEVAVAVGETEYLENKFDYKREWTGGYVNNGVFIVKYDSLEIKEVKQP